MKILLIGGYGVFGARLASLLVRDGHEVTIAGRSEARARSLATDLGCRALRLDRTSSLEAIGRYQVVIDAAGPFHSYGSDPYRIARAAISSGIHYLDLSDNAEFCTGISALDAEARSIGVCVLSGVSSVPAISSAAVVALSGDDKPSVIDTAILPGNRAPRGLSVMQSILTQAGRQMPVWRGGKWTQVRGWSDPQDYHLPGGLVRQGWQIEVPDQRLFPAHFGAESVVFRAGLELGVMRYGLAAFSLLRRVAPFPVTHPLVQVFKFGADMLSPFGTGRGGMSVAVQAGTTWRRWSLIAEDGDGPFIPGIAARALLRREILPVGAGAAVGILSLDEIEGALSDLRVVTERETSPQEHIFPKVLGEAFSCLPAEVRTTHQTVDRSVWVGRASVARGDGVWPRLLCRVFGFPEESEDVEVEVIKEVSPRGETWIRRFSNHRFRSRLSAGPEGMTERFGPFSFLLGLRVEKGSLHYPVRAGRLGPIPLPRWALPVSVAREYVDEGQFRFDVELRAPLSGAMMVRYRGYLEAARRDDPENPDQPQTL